MSRTKVLIVISLLVANASAQLSPGFHDYSCPQLIPIVRAMLRNASQENTWLAASLLRLHFHDCFVNGCDGSILLDDRTDFTGEKSASPNKNSARGFDVVDDIKAAIEEVCPETVSCADVLALTAREAVVMMGGPSWIVVLGRRDGISASVSQANRDIPKPSSNLSELINMFQARGLSGADLVALSGAHTIGQAHCSSFRNRLYNFTHPGEPDPRIDEARLKYLQSQCPENSTDDNLVALDPQTPTRFDNSYFVNLQSGNGLLSSDQELSPAYNQLIATYAASQDKFFKDFARAMVKMGKIEPITGLSGEIRKNCRVPNDLTP